MKKNIITNVLCLLLFSTVVNGQGNTAQNEHRLTGKTAPDWTLSDYNNESFALQDFTSKVILIEFSGIMCPPCHAALPFLKQLVADYEDKSFELIRIECWEKNVNIIKRYCFVNEIEYKFLLRDLEIEKNYFSFGVPQFFILDENRTIQYFMQGYGLGTTDKKIRDAIDELLEK